MFELHHPRLFPQDAQGSGHCSFTSLVLVHSALSSVFEKTILDTVFILAFSNRTCFINLFFSAWSEAANPREPFLLPIADP
jgi:hypothetical protein